MLKYYLGVIWEVPGLARSKTEAVVFWLVGVVVPIVLLIRPDLATELDGAAVQRMSGAVLVIALGQAALRANYARVQRLQKDLREAQSVIADRSAVKAVRTALGRMSALFSAIQQECFVHQAPVDDIHQRIAIASDNATTYVAQYWDDGEAALFNPTHVIPLDEAAQKIKDEGFPQYAKLYMMAQHHVVRLHALIEKVGLPAL